MTSFASASPAQAKEVGLVGRAWQLVQETWQFGGLWHRTPAPTSRPQRNMGKEGLGLDPNGKPAPTPVCGSCSDLGHGIDPNG